MKICLHCFLFLSSFISNAVFAQHIILISDSIMNERMKSGYANKHFRPSGSYNDQKQRAGFWKDFEVREEGSFQEVDGEPMKSIGIYLLYGEGKFENDKRTGEWTTYVIENKTDRKILSQKLSYADGIAEGPFTYFYPNGDKAQEGSYRNGKMEGGVTMYYTGGSVFGKQLYVDGIKQGEQKYFYRSGKPHFTIIYNEGRKNGPYSQWYENENLKETFNYSQDSIDGVYRYYYPDGKLWTEKQYDRGKLMNLVVTYDKNGKELDKGDLKNGNGIVNYYDEDGNIYQKSTYKEGKEIKTETIKPAKFK